VISIMIDKSRFSEMLQQVGVPRPNTRLLRSLDEMAAQPEDCYSGTFLKPLNSSLQNSIKGFIIQGKHHAGRIMQRSLRTGQLRFPILLQEYIPGPVHNQYLLDGFVDRRGRVCALMARRKLRMSPPVLGNTSFCETVGLNEVQRAVDALRMILEWVHYRGIFNAEFKYDDRDDQFKIIELNARPWWFVEFATRCGMNVCHMAYRDALDLPVQTVSSYATGRRCAYLLPDFAALCKSKPGMNGLIGWLRTLRGTQDLLYNWADPKPGVSAFLSSLKRRLVFSPIGRGFFGFRGDRDARP
jgi:D-aspartate ligase